MEKQLSRALETRPFVSGTHSKNAREARRVARAGLTTGGSSDDTILMNDLHLKPFCVVCHGLCSYFSLSFCGFLLCALTSHFIPATSPFWALQYPISRRPPQPSKPVHTSHLYPAIPLLRHTYILYIHTTHASILFCIHFFFHPAVLVSSHPSYHLDLCSILYSPFVPIALP